MRVQCPSWSWCFSVLVLLRYMAFHLTLWWCISFFSSFLFCSKLQKNVIAWRANFLHFTKKIVRRRCRCPRRHFCVYFSIPWIRVFQVFYQRWFDPYFLLLLFVDPSPPAALLHHEAKWLASTPTQTTMMMEGEVSHNSLVLCRLRSQYHPTWWVMTTSIF